MPRTQQAFREIRERTNKRILEAAAHVFAKKGLGATISDIAAEAGVSQGLAYRYFPSKEAIYHALLRQMLRSAGAANLAGEVGKTPRERLERIVTGVLVMRRNHPDFYRFVFQALSDDRLPKDIHNQLNSHGHQVRRLMLKLVIEGQERGEISKGDPGELVDVILACLEGLSMRLAYSGPGAEAHIPDAEVILRVLGPDRSGRDV